MAAEGQKVMIPINLSQKIEKNSSMYVMIDEKKYEFHDDNYK